MSKQIGVQMIDMYCNMIKDQFQPIIDILNHREKLLQKNLEIEARKELGIYDLYVKKAKLKLELDEIKRQLDGWESRDRHPDGTYGTPVEHLVQVKLTSLRSPIRKEVDEILQKLIYKIKLSGLNADAKEVFTDLPNIIKELSDKLSSQATITSVGQAKQIASKIKKGHKI